ncbi:hypothetical protein CARUB_v10024914mg [Capsella rubella]|uniref:MADS-box domain-containing protein n=1 Tax=Capsella rubella TaxID=81985 RepID=R0HX76_9BRAS|nr:agamous-like MADS-box protein AGL61 [Capsella rubella]EOA28688.1 hypothetical protein CARUB_v10024914mg [Capsella rubella]
MMSKKKESIGRQKIPMVKIKKESHRQVTFSKRRAGLFKKASELCTLCGAEIGIIVFSPAKKPFSFGHPSVESVLDRYMSRNNMSLAQTTQQQPQGNPAAGCELNMQLTQVLSEVEEEKKKGQAMEEIRKASVRRSATNWWEKPVEEMNMFQLQEMKNALEELRKTVVANMAPYTEVKEDVYGFLDNKVATAPHPYMNMSSGLSSIYSFANGNNCF